MESAWPLILVALSCVAAVLLLLSTVNNRRRRLPPGPLAVPLLGNLLWLRHSLQELEPLLRSLHATYGPILTLRIGSRPAIFISDHTLTHHALINHGAAFSDRPTPLPASRFISRNQHNISSAAYGPLWRLLRRNLASEILSPARVNLYSPGRRWVLSLLISHLRPHAGAVPTEVMPSFQFAMFCLLVLMCFGEKLDEEAIRDIEAAQRNFLLYVGKLNVFAFVPKLARYIFRKRWATAVALRKRQLDLYTPLIKARRQHKRGGNGSEGERYVHSYLDSLLDIQLPEEGGRGLTDEEIVGLCSEFLNAGTDTTSTALQWIMAELVQHPSIQTKLLEEIESVATLEKDGEVKEEELQRMPYLRAVVMEGLRRHPPGHFVLPHAVTEEIAIGGYVIPKNASVNFMVAEMNWDGKVWEEPMEFKPERFLVGGTAVGVDITGSREVRMMPFGVGRRICPGLGLAMLHLEYFVANLVREFEWNKVEGEEEVDMSEKVEFTVVMKKPLRACIVPRRKTIDTPQLL